MNDFCVFADLALTPTSKSFVVSADFVLRKLEDQATCQSEEPESLKV